MKNSIYTSEYQRFLMNLRNARLECGLTQPQVATLLGQPQSYVSKCETGEKRVDVIELMRFAKIYNKEMDYFVKDIFLKSGKTMKVK